MKTNQRFIKSHKYAEPGIYKITIHAENLQGNSSASHRLIAQHPILKYWKLTSNSPQLLPGTVKFSISYPPEKTLPTNATATLNYGDGKHESWQIEETGWTGEQIFEHEYLKPGKYKVHLNISNTVTTVIRRIQVN